MRSKPLGILCGLAAVSLSLVHAQSINPPLPTTVAPATAPAAQAQPASSPAAGLQTGPATVARHWSKYHYPETIPDGATYYIIQRGDTLWDLAKRFLNNPFLWPQIWDQNRYITDAHWIYPGDPLIMPKVSLVSDRAGQGETTGQTGAETPGGAGAAGAAGAAGNVLQPVIEEMALQCAHYVVSSPEDTSLYIIGSEQGATKIAYADRDILYLSKGSNAGVKAGDVYSLHHPSYDVKHPDTGRNIGTKVETTGWVRVVLVQENAATVMVEAACADIHAGDYALPFQRASVPMLVPRPAANRMTPPTGKVEGRVVDIGDDSMIAGTGQLVTINLGSSNGISPGNILTVFKIMYPSVPTSRNVLGEVTVVAVRERTATAKVTYSSDAIMNGDRVELK